MSIIKFGGSVITDASQVDLYNSTNTRRLANELYPYFRGSVLIHGTGHVGKPPAIRYGYYKSGVIQRQDRLIAIQIRQELRLLNQRFLQTFISASIPVIPLDIVHFFEASMDRLVDPDACDRLLDLISNGLVPIFYGDLMPQTDGSFRVFSSDTMALVLAKTLAPENVFLLSDVNGLYADGPHKETGACHDVIKKLNHATLGSMLKMRSDARDVSGGMYQKAVCALEICRYSNRCVIASGVTPGVLSELFRGNADPGTCVMAEDRQLERFGQREQFAV